MAIIRNDERTMQAPAMPNLREQIEVLNKGFIALSEMLGIEAECAAGNPVPSAPIDAIRWTVEALHGFNGNLSHIIGAVRELREALCLDQNKPKG